LAEKCKIIRHEAVFESLIVYCHAAA